MPETDPTASSALYLGGVPNCIIRGNHIVGVANGIQMRGFYIPILIFIII